MKKIHYGKNHLYLPDSYDEVSAKQTIKLIRLYYANAPELVTLVAAFRIVTGISAFKFYRLSDNVLNECLQYLHWVMHLTIPVKQLLPFYHQLFAKKYYGPISDFNNLTMEEFHLTEIFYKEAIDGEHDTQLYALSKLAAVLYRPCTPGYNLAQNPAGDYREPFNKHLLTYRVKHIKRWPKHIKQVIFTWYQANRQALINNNKLVFEKSDDDSSSINAGLYGILRAMAGDKLGNINAIEKMNIHTAMLELSLIKEEANRIEEQSNNPL